MLWEEFEKVVTKFYFISVNDNIIKTKMKDIKFSSNYWSSNKWYNYMTCWWRLWLGESRRWFRWLVWGASWKKQE